MKAKFAYPVHQPCLSRPFEQRAGRWLEDECKHQERQPPSIFLISLVLIKLSVVFQINIFEVQHVKALDVGRPGFEPWASAVIIKTTIYHCPRLMGGVGGTPLLMVIVLQPRSSHAAASQSRGISVCGTHLTTCTSSCNLSLRALLIWAGRCSSQTLLIISGFPTCSRAALFPL